MRFETGRGTFESLEAPEAFNKTERSPDAHVLDNAVLEDLLAVIKQAQKILELERAAGAVIAREITDNPAFESTIRCPQSPDKHAEGPLVEDHVRLMLMHVAAIADGTLQIPSLSEFRDAIAELSGAQAAAARAAFTRLEQDIRKNPALFEVFALYHDLAKPDTLGFFGRNSEEITPERYVALQEDFAREHADLLTQPSRFQEEFFRTYGISVTNYRHGEVAARERKDEIVRAADRRGLLAGEQEMLLRAIELHIEVHARFASAPDGRGYGKLLKKFEGLARPAADGLRLLQAGALLDVLGTKAIAPDNSRHSRARLPLNVILAAEEFALLQAEDARRLEYKNAAAAAGFTSEWIINGLGLRDRVIGEVQRAVEAAVKTGTLDLPAHLESHRAALDEKIRSLRERLVEN